MSVSHTNRILLFSVQLALGTIDWPGAPSVLWSLKEFERVRTHKRKWSSPIL